jgi:dihydrofolate reductase
MRKVNVLEFVSLDGVIQAPGGPEDDTSGGFAYGGWISPHSDPVVSTAIRKRMNMPFDLLIGRRTFEMWAPYWPQHNDMWPAVNRATKYVRLEYHVFSRMAAVRVSKRRYCGKNQPEFVTEIGHSPRPPKTGGKQTASATTGVALP